MASCKCGRVCRTLAVDVSSGVESAKGVKDPDKIHQFVAAVRAADALLARSPNMPSYQQPDAAGHFGPYGGSFVSETLTHAIDELRDAYARYQHDPEFLREFNYELAHFVGRPSPVYHADRMSREMGGAQIYLKREDLNHTGAHKINNVIGQAMLARRMGKPRVIAETGAGQHGVATATICARYGLECVVYMGSEDVKRQSPNVYRMNLLGARVVPVESGSKTLKDALNEAMRDWVTNVENTFYIIGTVAGPHPYPMMVRDFQSVIGNECLEQMPADGRPPARCRGSPAWAAAAMRWASSIPTSHRARA
jgi:tryptophan synthase beta chain